MSEGLSSPRLARGDRGSAIVEFTLVGVLLTVLFLALLQLGLALHVRNTLAASAAEGARFGANADRTPGEGAALARQLIRDSLADTFADDVTADVEQVGGFQTVVIRVRARLPVLGLLGPARGISVQGHAVEEAQ